MEDPKREIVNVARGLLARPSFKQQAEVVRHYYAPNARFHHYLVDVSSGVDDIVAIYQMAHAFFNYQAIEVLKVLYDDHSDHIALQITVYSRPWISLGREVSNELLLHIHLEDWPQQDGKVLKRIKFQRGFFERDQFLLTLPIIGSIYGSSNLRFLLGHLEAVGFQTLRYIFAFFLPSNIKHGLLGLWVHSMTHKDKHT